MADNLSVSVTADTSELRAQLALAQADLRAFAAETRKLASDIRGGGDASGVLRGQLEQIAGQFNHAKSEVSALTAALREHKAAHEETASGIKGVTAALETLASPVSSAVAGFRDMAEVLGVAFAVEKIAEFAKEMAELGERTVNMAAAVGTTPEKFAELSAEMRLAGGNADTAGRTLERLGKNISLALASPTSEQARAFKALGVTEEELRKASTDLEYALRLLAEKFVAFQDTPSKTAAFMALLGRGMENLIPLFRKGGEGLDEFKQKAQEAGGVLSGPVLQALADSREKMNLLGTAATGLAGRLVAGLKPAIDAITDSLTSMIAMFNRALGLGAATAAQHRSALGAELDNVNRRIAEGSEEHVRFGAHGSRITTPALEEGEVRHITRGPRFGQLDTSVNNLATLRARAAELQQQMAQIDEDERQRATASFGTGGKPVVPPLEKPEKPARAGRAHAAPAETDDTERRELERLGAEEKVDEAILDRRTKLIEATFAAGKISLDQESALLLEQADKRWAIEQEYFAKKKTAAAGRAPRVRSAHSRSLAACRPRGRERGLHALHSVADGETLDVKAYAARVGRARETVRNEVCAAEVADTVADVGHKHTASRPFGRMGRRWSRQSTTRRATARCCARRDVRPPTRRRTGLRPGRALCRAHRCGPDDRRHIVQCRRADARRARRGLRGGGTPAARAGRLR
jgi:hypothetical protein